MGWAAGILVLVAAFTSVSSYLNGKNDVVRRRLFSRRTARPGALTKIWVWADHHLAPEFRAAGIDDAGVRMRFLFVLSLGALITALGVATLSVHVVSGFLTFVGLTVACGPLIWLRFKCFERRANIERNLPMLAETLAVGLEAGATLETSLVRMAPLLKGPLAEEVQHALTELSLGATRREALWRMAERAGVPEMTSLVTTVVQSEELGSGLATVMRTQARQMRARQMQRAEKAASQAPVKLLFPLVLFVFPGLLILLLGPLFLGHGVR